MRKAPFAVILLVLLVSAGCGPSLKRIGYETPTAPMRENCDVTFIEPEQNKKIPGKLLGTLKVGDSGVSLDCNETVVRKLLREEACRIGADVVVLRDVQKPGFSSSCYRVTADLVQSGDTLGPEMYMAMQKQDSTPAYPPKTYLYATFGYGAAAMTQLNGSIEHDEAAIRAKGYPIDLQTFDPGGFEIGMGGTARFHPSFSVGWDLIYQSMSVESYYADAHLELSDKMDASMIDVELRLEYWPAPSRGFNVGGILAVPFGKFHEVTSITVQDPSSQTYSDMAFWNLGLGIGAFLGYELPIGSRGIIFTRLGYRYRVLGTQLINTEFVDSQGQKIETDFSGFYVICGLGFRMKTYQQPSN